MQIVPLQPVPAQVFDIALDGKTFTLNVYTKKQYDWPTRLSTLAIYLDIAINGTAILQGALALTDVPIIRSQYLLQNADLCFFDQLGNENPVWTGLGDRWGLMYYNVSDNLIF